MLKRQRCMPQCGVCHRFPNAGNLQIINNLSYCTACASAVSIFNTPPQTAVSRLLCETCGGSIHNSTYVLIRGKFNCKPCAAMISAERREGEVNSVSEWIYCRNIYFTLHFSSTQSQGFKIWYFTPQARAQVSKNFLWLLEFRYWYYNLFIEARKCNIGKARKKAQRRDLQCLQSILWQ